MKILSLLIILLLASLTVAVSYELIETQPLKREKAFIDGCVSGRISAVMTSLEYQGVHPDDMKPFIEAIISPLIS